MVAEPMSTTGLSINVRDVSIAYHTSKRRVDAVRDASFDIASGELVALRGRSGSGKTSLLFAIAGLVRPASGSVRVAGTDPWSLGDADAAAFRLRNIGLVFQFFQLLHARDAADNVAVPLELLGYPHREARRRAIDLLAELGLEERATHRPFELSGGEQQRVAVARALIADPHLILADEPTGNLDDESAETVAALLVSSTQGKRTLLVATHDDRLTNRVNRTLRMSNGVLSESDGDF